MWENIGTKFKPCQVISMLAKDHKLCSREEHKFSHHNAYILGRGITIGDLNSDMSTYRL